MIDEATGVSPIYEFRSVHGECPEVPDDLSLPQFFLDWWHPLRPMRTAGSPWVIDDESGKTLDYEQVRQLMDQTGSLLPVPTSDPLDRSGRGVMVSHRPSGHDGV